MSAQPSQSSPPGGPSPDLLRLLAHPLRRAILSEMMGEQDDGRRYSPRELSDLVGYPINDVAYHVRVLLKYKALRKRGTEPVRGATKHFYALGDLIKENEEVVLLFLGTDEGPPPGA
jgi:hypothetical protein